MAQTIFCSLAAKRWNRKIHEEMDQSVTENDLLVQDQQENHEIQQQMNQEDSEISEPESFDLEIIPESKAPDNFSLERRRIVNIKHFWEQLKQIKHIPSFTCSIENCNIIGEKRCGLISTFTVKCDMFGEKSYLKTEQSSGTEMNCNTLSVIGKNVI